MKQQEVKKVEKSKGCFSTTISINDTDIVDMSNEDLSSLVEDILVTQNQEFKDSLSELLEYNGYEVTDDADLAELIKNLLEEQEVFSKEEEDMRRCLGEILIDYFYDVLTKTHESLYNCGQCGDSNGKETWER